MALERWHKEVIIFSDGFWLRSADTVTCDTIVRLMIEHNLWKRPTTRKDTYDYGRY